MDHDAVITGRGILTPLATGVQTFEQSLFAPLGNIDGRWTSPQLIDRALLRELRAPSLTSGDNFAVMTSTAVEQALREAGLCDLAMNDGVGLIMSTFFGPTETVTAYLERLRKKGPIGASPTAFINSHLNMAAGLVSAQFRLRGSILALNGTDPFELALALISQGHGPLIVGGVDQLAERTLILYEDWRTSRGIVREVSAPFAKRRTLPMFAEASSFVVIESADSARQRGVVPLARIRRHCSIGGISYDRFGDPVRIPGASEIKRGAAMIGNALLNVRADQSVIVACANSSVFVDGLEGAILELVGGGRLTVPIKAVTGETPAAASAVSIIGAIAMKKAGVVPRYLLAPHLIEHSLNFGGRESSSPPIFLVNYLCSSGLSSLLIGVD